LRVAVSTPAEVAASGSSHRRRWPVRLGAVVCVASVVVVLHGPLTTFAWRVQLQFWSVIEQVSYYGLAPGRLGHSFSVTLRPDATRQDLEDLAMSSRIRLLTGTIGMPARTVGAEGW
jgi:hypothetical protein